MNHARERVCVVNVLHIIEKEMNCQDVYSLKKQKRLMIDPEKNFSKIAVKNRMND